MTRRRPSRRPSRRLALSVGLVTASLVAAATALAALGDLTPAGCVGDNDTGTDVCAESSDGLADAISVVTSADGNSVYAAARGDDAVVRFDRDPVDGTLTPKGCIDDNDPPSGPDTCGRSADGLDGLLSVAVSPDGESVYTAGNSNDAIVRFNRKPSGQLVPKGCVDDPTTGPELCATTAQGLGDASAVAVSPDGTSVYAVSSQDSSIVRFNRKPSGALVPKGCITQAGGVDICGGEFAPGLTGSTAVTVSPDGTSVYVAGTSNDAVAVFKRNPSSGVLTPRACIGDNDSGGAACAQTTDGLDGIQSIAVSPDGASVYAAGSLDDAVVRLNRNPANGALTPKGCIDDNDIGSGPDACATSADGLNGAAGVAVSADGRSVYVGSRLDDTVAIFRRSTASGKLTAEGCVGDNTSATEPCSVLSEALDGPTAVALSGDASVYVTGIDGDSVAAFSRDTLP